MSASARPCARVLVAATFVVLLACASDIYRQPTAFRPAAIDRGGTLVIARTVEVTPRTGYPRALDAGSRWRHVGRISQGRVFAIQNDVFTVTGRHVHEAQLVFADRARLVGFFLPVEEAFVPLAAPVELAVRFQQ